MTQLSSARVVTGSYRPQHGLLTTAHIEKGVREFIERIENGENNVIVAVWRSHQEAAWKNVRWLSLSVVRNAL